MSAATKRTLSIVSSTLLGLVFLLSSVVKAWDAESFADTLLQYGPHWMGVGAPVVIVIEAILGMMLLLRVRVRDCAIGSCVFLVSVSAVFAYGVLAKGITDCGCFGQLFPWMNGKPYLVFLRNTLLVGISIPAWFRLSGKECLEWPKMIVILLVTAAIAFISGLSMHRSYRLPKWSSVRTDSRSETMRKLQSVCPLSADSSYYVYLFSFTCPHCLNSFANVQQYGRLHVVDRVVYIAVSDEDAQARFERIYQPEDSIITISKQEMAQITGQLPVGLLIKGNTIERSEVSFILSPGIFMENETEK